MKIIGSYPKTRLRRLRKSEWIRNLVSENNISSKDLILPIFVREGKGKIESINSMPGIKRYSIQNIESEFKYRNVFVEIRSTCIISYLYSWYITKK